jgi:Predicted Zn-dependent peptidases
MIEKYYSAWKPGYVAPKIEPEPVQTAPRERTVEYDGKTLPIVTIGYKCDAFDVKNKEYMAILPFADLAFGENSDLYRKLVLEEQKVQFIAGDAPMKRDPFPFMIYTRVKSESDIDYVISEIEATIEKYKTELIDPVKLEGLKKRMKYGFLMRLDSPEAVASSLPMYITLTGDITVIDEYFDALMSVTPEDIRNAVNHYFVKTGRNQVILKGN